MNFDAVAARPDAGTRSPHEATPKISCRKLDFFYGKFQAPAALGQLGRARAGGADPARPESASRRCCGR